jgi:FkbM family methyltransferase
MKTYSLVDHTKFPLDWKLNDIFNKEKGFYIELVANDGITYSNTAFLEYEKNWTGILIEPSSEKYEECLKNRPDNIIINCACVSNEYKENTIYGDFDIGSMMSSINGNRLGNNNLVEVKSLTLEKILDFHLPMHKIVDFLSLDVEGYEFEVLKGLNFEKYSPKYILVEIYTKDMESIFNFLKEKDYELISNFTNYNHSDNPGWDGTHNDFLFKKN